MASSLEIRNDLARILHVDLVGPEPGNAYEKEALEIAPSRFYLTGFLVPHEADEDWKSAVEENAEIDAEEGDGTGDDEASKDKASARKAFFPSSLGLSVCVPPGTQTLEVTASWGDYTHDSAKGDEANENAGSWQRHPRLVTWSVPVATKSHEVPGHADVRLSVIARPLKLDPKSMKAAGLEGAVAVSVFLVNERKQLAKSKRNECFMFQAKLRLRCATGFVGRPNLRGLHSKDADELIADLQYRDAPEYAVGHGVSTHLTMENGRCTEAITTWMPQAQVEKVIAAPVAGEFDMGTLARTTDGEALIKALSPLVVAYRDWLSSQNVRGLSAARADVAASLLRDAGAVCDRLENGISLLRQPQVFRAFTLANAAMESQARQRNKQKGDLTSSPQWRPFQLAFVLMNLRGIVDPTHADRERVDLLFFPTGGGKTEAYLGLAALTLLYRRLTNPGLASAGVSVLMRYTLRLLTLDQLQRAATLICALELLRKQNGDLGPWPFEIGLWVGRAATPNKMGKKGETDSNSARARVMAYANDSKSSLPIPLETCPWCGAGFSGNSFSLEPNQDAPTDLRVRCLNRQHDADGKTCAFSGQSLPILTVDEPIYRRLPCFLIATMDKFAALPWEARAGALFGKVDRHDANGFYGAADPGVGRRLPTPMLPPDLIIQDELHLISGPLGTVSGLYEAAIEQLASRTADGKVLRPKLVASTATVRRAQNQIQQLFARGSVEIFPPPGPDRRDSFFARTVSPSSMPARLYVGVAAPGRSLKVVLLRTYLALLSAGQRHYLAEGAETNTKNPADPYMTLLGYFNSLRDLGGSRRIIEDEVLNRLPSMTRARRRFSEEAAPHFSSRKIKFNVMELTSRESNADVARAKRKLEQPFHMAEERVDVAIATNMISVGLDITRLGLMVVLGQPKTTAEYIQASSRVGRDEKRPGLVVTLLNVHKPRDRSHFERFEHFHETFYRSVEATSVTPFSPRAIDRALPGVVVGLVRHGRSEFTAPRGALAMADQAPLAQWVADAMKERAARAGHSGEASDVRGRVMNLLDQWHRIATEQVQANAGLQYQREVGNDPALLHTPLDPDLVNLPPPRDLFKANRSLRDVEPSVNLFIRVPGTDRILEEG